MTCFVGTSAMCALCVYVCMCCIELNTKEMMRFANP